MGAFFNHAGASPPTHAVIDRMTAHLRREHDIGGYEAAAEIIGELAGVRATLGAALGGDPAGVALTAGATDGWERVMWAYLTRPEHDAGARIVVDPFTYISMWTSLLRWRAFRSIDLVVAAPLPDGTVDVQSLAELVTPDTAAVVITHVPTHAGTVTPAAEALAVARAAAPDALLVLDVSQTAGQMPLQVGAWDCDVAFAPGRKFLRSPRGTGVLWVRPALVPDLVPLGLPGAASAVDGRIVGLPDDATRFEVFERPIASMLGLGVAVGELVDLGLDTVAERVTANSRAVTDIVAGHAHLRPAGTPDDRGILTFTHPTLTVSEVSARLAEQGVASRPVPGVATFDDDHGGFRDVVRLSPHHCTTPDELAQLDAGLATLPS